MAKFAAGDFFATFFLSGNKIIDINLLYLKSDPVTSVCQHLLLMLILFKNFSFLF